MLELKPLRNLLMNAEREAIQSSQIYSGTLGNMSRNVIRFRAVLTYGDTGQKHYCNWYLDKRCAVYDTNNTSDPKHDLKYGNRWTIEEEIVNLDSPDQLSLFELKI